MSFDTNNNVKVLVGLAAELPDPATIAEGTIYWAYDTDQPFIVEINPSTFVRTWELLTAGGAPPIGPAGGDLAGTYPNPTLAAIIATVVTWNGHQTFAVPPTVPAPVAGTDAANKTYVDNADTALSNALVHRDGSLAFTGDQSMGGHKLTNVATPTSGLDAANKDYVDGAAGAVVLARYVDTATGSNANDGTAGHPWQTLDFALSQVKTGQTMTIQLTAGQTFPVSGTGQIAPGARVKIQGSYADVGIGTRTVAAGSTASTVVDSVGGFVVDAYVGARLQFTTGAHAGEILSLRSNTAANLVGFVSLTGAPAPGDQFVVERPSPVIQVGAGGWVQALAGSQLTLSAVKMSFTGVNTFALVDLTGGELYAAGLEVDFGTSQGTLGLSGCVATLGALTPTTTQAFGVANRGLWSHGCYLHATTTSAFGLTVRDGGELYGYNTALAAVGADLLLGATVTLNGFDFTGAASAGLIVEQGARAFLQCPQDFGSPSRLSGGAKVTAQKGATLRMVTIDVAGATGDAVTVSNSAASLSTVTSASNASGFGLRLKNGGRVTNEGANNVTGASGDIQVGGNAGATTWGAAAASVTDVGAATPQLCVIGPA